MKYKGILIDLDDTIYNYEKAHRRAINEVVVFFGRIYNMSVEDAISLYEKAKNQVHIRLFGQAASHNRLLYFQTMIELINKSPAPIAMDLYNNYWDVFLENMEVYEEVILILEEAHRRAIPICLLSDLTSHIQYRKVSKLGITTYLTHIVTSEEVGAEKPHPHMFYCALNKLGMTKDDVVMMGDNYKKDILGAENIGMRSVWINHKGINKPIGEGCIEIRNLADLKEKMHE